MPTYEFRCAKCGKTVSLAMSIAEYAANKPKCPKCGSTRIERQITSVTTQTSRKS